MCLETPRESLFDYRVDMMDDTMTKNGYTQNPYYRCCYDKIVDGVQITALRHVDDFFMTSKSEGASRQGAEIYLQATLRGNILRSHPGL